MISIYDKTIDVKDYNDLDKDLKDSILYIASHKIFKEVSDNNDIQ